MKVKIESEVAQSCPTFCDPMDCNLPGSSVHGIFQARVLKWGPFASSSQESLRTVNTIHKNDWSLKQDVLTTRWCQDSEDGIFVCISL